MNNLQLISYCSPSVRRGSCVDWPHAWPSQVQPCLWAMEHPAALGSISAVCEAATVQPFPYLAQREGADGVGRQLHCIQQGHLDHPIGFRTPARPVLVTLYLQRGEENGSVIGYWLGHLG